MFAELTASSSGVTSPAMASTPGKKRQNEDIYGSHVPVSLQIDSNYERQKEESKSLAVSNVMNRYFDHQAPSLIEECSQEDDDSRVEPRGFSSRTSLKRLLPAQSKESLSHYKSLPSSTKSGS